MLNGKKTYIVAAVGAILGAWQASGHDVPAWAFAILGSLGLSTLRAGVASTAAKTATVVLAALMLTACANPQAQQGTAGQGGSTGPTPAVVIYIGSDHGTVTVTSAPTAAPAAASTATAAQTATNDVKPAVGTDAVKALAPVPALPVPTPAPAPVK